MAQEGLKEVGSLGRKRGLANKTRRGEGGGKPIWEGGGSAGQMTMGLGVVEIWCRPRWDGGELDGPGEGPATMTTCCHAVPGGSGRRQSSKRKRIADVIKNPTDAQLAN